MSRLQQGNLPAEKETSFVASHVDSRQSPYEESGSLQHDGRYGRQAKPSLSYSMSRHRERSVRRSAWSRPWSWTQLLSHVSILYCIGCCAFTDGSFVIWFWAVFVVTLLLYLYVCLANTQYRETPVDLTSDAFELRRCEDCDNNISAKRVKHCHLCNKCVADFDHHCRYLNSCIAGRTYNAWAIFVCGLLALMVGAAMSAIDNVQKQDPDEAPTLQWAACAFSAALSCLLALFLACLLLQHLYLACQGITTLEYVKSQDPGYPGLPPQGWRNSVKKDLCHRCGDDLILSEPCEDKDEICVCCICQVDLAKAQVSFMTCEGCAGDVNSVNVCIICRRISELPDRQVTTSRVATLRREPPYMGGSGGDGSGRVSDLRMPSTSSVHRGQIHYRHSFSALLASVEGGTGDAGENQACGGMCGSGDNDESSSEGDDGDDL